MAGWQTDKGIFTTQKIKQGLRLVLCEIAYSMSIYSSQCTFHGFIKDILPTEKRCELQFTSVPNVPWARIQSAISNKAHAP